jgi:hypothetical protein
LKGDEQLRLKLLISQVIRIEWRLRLVVTDRPVQQEVLEGTITFGSMLAIELPGLTEN